MRKGPPIPHGACRAEELPDGRVVVSFWNDKIEAWTYEHPDDRGERGLSAGCLFILLMGALIALVLWIA